jgi:heterodisulfide reductase subunit A
MDIQQFGKGFDAFYKDCQKSITFIRSRPYEILEGPNGSVHVKYTPPPKEGESQVKEDEFDLVVLAVGIRPSQDSIKLAETLLIPVDEYGFLGFKSASSFPTLQRSGIYAAGACESPKDIQNSMAQAEAVSTAILETDTP